MPSFSHCSWWGTASLSRNVATVSRKASCSGSKIARVMGLTVTVGLSSSKGARAAVGMPQERDRRHQDTGGDHSLGEGAVGTSTAERLVGLAGEHRPGALAGERA